MEVGALTPVPWRARKAVGPVTNLCPVMSDCGSEGTESTFVHYNISCVVRWYPLRLTRWPKSARESWICYIQRIEYRRPWRRLSQRVAESDMYRQWRVTHVHVSKASSAAQTDILLRSRVLNMNCKVSSLQLYRTFH